MGNCLEFPVLAFEQRVGFFEVGDAHFLGVPVQALAGELAGDHAKAQGLGQRAGVVEAGEGLVLAFDGV